MSLYKFAMGLKSTLSKDEVLSSISETQQIITKYTLPACIAAEELWRGQKFKNVTSRNIEESVKRDVKNKPLFETLRFTMQNTQDLLGSIEEYAQQIFHDKEANIGLNYAKAMTMRLVQAAELCSTYTRRLINYVYWLEGQSIGSEVIGPKQAEIDWIKEKFDSYLVGMHALQKDKDALQKALKELPDAVVTSTTEMTLTQTLGIGAVDPFGLNQLSVRWNPFYLLGMVVAEWQASRYEQAKDELQLLEYRRMQIEKLRSKTQDARLDQEIEYLQERITGMYAKIDKMEKNYNV